MAKPTGIRQDVRVFISAVTKEFATVRLSVKNALLDNKVLPIEQSHFGPDAGGIDDFHRRQIVECDAVIHIVGVCYGNEPTNQPANVKRLSYTQREYDFAAEAKVPIYVFLVNDGFETDSHEQEPGELLMLQQMHRQRLVAQAQTANGKFYVEVGSRQELDQRVRTVAKQMIEGAWNKSSLTIARKLGLGMATLAGLMGVVYRGLKRDVKHGATVIRQEVQAAQSRTEQKIYETAKHTASQVEGSIEKAVQKLINPGLLAERIRSEIRETAEAKINEVPKQPGRYLKIAEIEKERDIALGRVDDLIKLIQEGLKQGESPIFERAAEILEDEGIDAVLDYLDRRRPATLDEARRLADQAKAAQAQADEEKKIRNRALKPMIFEAGLAEIKLQWNRAIGLREKMVDLAPDWFDAQHALGRLLFEVGRYQEAEFRLRSALQLSTTLKEKGASTNNLVLVLRHRGRPYEAEILIRSSLAADESTYGPRDSRVAADLDTLASLLWETGRVAEAKVLMRRAVAIELQSEAESQAMAGMLIGNLAIVIADKDHLARGISLTRHALEAKEKCFGSANPIVAGEINNLAKLLERSGRTVDAESLLRRCISIYIKAYGSDHPKLRIMLHNLAELLVKSNCTVDAESILSHALVVDELEYGPESLEVAADIERIGKLLVETDRLMEAALLMHRSLEIVGRFRQVHRVDSPASELYMNNYVFVLRRMQHSDDEILQRLKAAMQPEGRLTPISPKVRQLFGDARSLAEVLTALDGCHMTDQKPEIYFVPLDEPITSHINKLLGPAKAMQDVLIELDTEYREEGKPVVWFLSLEEPITPHLDEFLGRTQE